MGLTVGEFFVRIGAKVDFSKISEYEDRLDKSAKDIAWSFTKLSATLIGTYIALDKIVQKTSQLYIDIYNINKQTGLQGEKMLEIQNIARMANPNATAQDVLQSLSAIEKNLISVRYLGKGNIAPYQLLGIQILGMNAIDVLDQLRKKAQEPFFKKNPALLTTLAQEMGVSAEMMNMLYLSDKEYEKFKRTKLVSPENQQAIKNLRLEFNRTNIELEYLLTNMVSGLSPTFESALGVVKKLSDDIQGLGDFFVKAAGGSDNLNKALILISTTIATVLFPKISMVTAALIAIEDIVKGLMGNKNTLTGKFIDKFIPEEQKQNLVPAVMPPSIPAVKKKDFEDFKNLIDSTGIDFGQKIKDAIPFKESIKDFLNFIGGGKIIGNNANNIRPYLEEVPSLTNANAIPTSTSTNSSNAVSTTFYNSYTITGENSNLVAEGIVENQKSLFTSVNGQFRNGAFA